MFLPDLVWLQIMGHLPKADDLLKLVRASPAIAKILRQSRVKYAGPLPLHSGGWMCEALQSAELKLYGAENKRAAVRSLLNDLMQQDHFLARSDPSACPACHFTRNLIRHRDVINYVWIDLIQD